MERTPDIYGARIKLMIGFTSLHPVVDELLLKRPLIFLKLVIIIPYITVNFSYLDVIIVRLSDISDLFTFTRKDPSYSLLSPVAILVIDRSLHAQKPRQDVDKHPEKRESQSASANQRPELLYCDQ